MNATAEDRRERDATFASGELLEGKYRVEHLLGQGGMATVWAGTNERTGKRVALKVLLPSLAATPGVDALFQREGLAASRIDHPNVVTVFDVIKHRDMACIVMELLTGETLDKLIARNGPLGVNDACALLLPAMRGVVAAHAQGVIHRDLKPQNIFVCIGPDGRVVTTKVLDFGISVILGRPAEPDGEQDPTVHMGTPAYVAPERIWGEVTGGPVIDARVDVYGFGVLFFEALTGTVPFPGEVSPSLFEHILSDPPPPLSGLCPELPVGFARVIETAMAKSPAARHASLDAMLLALEREVAAPGSAWRGETPTSAIASGTPAPEGGEVPAAPSSAGDGGTKRSYERRATRLLAGFPLEADGPERKQRREGPTPDALPPLPARAEAMARRRLYLRWAKVGTAVLFVGTALGIWALAAHLGDRTAPLPPLVVPTASPAGAAPPPSSARPVVEVTPLVAPAAPPAPLEPAVPLALPEPTSPGPEEPFPADGVGSETNASADPPRASGSTEREPRRRAARVGKRSRKLDAVSGSGRAKASAAPRARAGKLSAADF